MAHRAMRGGEIGANGEFYNGGQFVADNPFTVKGSAARKGGTRKIEIEPYKWIVAENGEKSIFSSLVGTVARWVYGDDRKTDFKKIELVPDVAEICKRNGWNLTAATELVARYNAGERIYTGRGIY